MAQDDMPPSRAPSFNGSSRFTGEPGPRAPSEVFRSVSSTATASKDGSGRLDDRQADAVHRDAVVDRQLRPEAR